MELDDGHSESDGHKKMDIINTGTQFADGDGDQQDVDDGSQYLALEENQENIVQENTGEVYIYIYIYI